MRNWFLLLCLGLCACSSLPESPLPDLTPMPNPASISAGIHAAISDSHFTPPIEVTDLFRAPPISSYAWIICIRGTHPVGPTGWTYSAFFTQTYVTSRYSVDADRCAGQRYHPFTDTPSLRPAPEPKKHDRPA